MALMVMSRREKIRVGGDFSAYLALFFPLLHFDLFSIRITPGFNLDLDGPSETILL